MKISITFEDVPESNKLYQAFLQAITGRSETAQEAESVQSEPVQSEPVQSVVEPEPVEQTSSEQPATTVVAPAPILPTAAEKTITPQDLVAAAIALCREQPAARPVIAELNKNIGVARVGDVPAEKIAEYAQALRDLGATI